LQGDFYASIFATEETDNRLFLSSELKRKVQPIKNYDYEKFGKESREERFLERGKESDDCRNNGYRFYYACSSIGTECKQRRRERTRRNGSEKERQEREQEERQKGEQESRQEKGF
jgi:hypothetical protein